MKPTEKIKSDQQRAAKAVDVALSSVAIEKSEGSSSSLFPTLDSKVAYVQALYAHKPREDEHGMLPATRTLTERLKMKKDEQYQRKVMELQVQRQMLEASKMQIEKEAEAVHGQVLRERGQKPMTLKEALANDARLEAMPASEVLREFVSEETTRAKRSNSFRKPLERTTRAAVEDEEEEEEEEEESSEEESSGDEEEETDSEEEDESQVITPPKGAAPTNKAPRHHVRSVAKKRNEDEDFMRAVEQETGIAMKKAKAAPSQPNDLKQVVKAIAGDIPSQEHHLKELKMKQALTLTKLQWMKKRPATYERGSIFPSTAKGKAMKDTCDQLVEEIVNKAWHKISMRPDPKEVAREVQEFKAKHMTVLFGIGRHLADAIVKDVVDELILEIASESNGLQKAADQYAFDLLVEAVASSQPDKKHGFHFRGEDVHMRMKEVSQAQEMLLRCKIDERRAVGDNRSRIGALSKKMESRVQFSADGDKDLLNESSREGGGPWGDGLDPFGKLDARNLDRIPDRPKLKIDSAKVAKARGDKLSDESDIYALQRSLDHGISLSEKALYIMGLKAMLEEMKRRRGEASPYGHIQQLAIAWPKGIHLSRARILAAQRMKPPLTAGAAIWKRREENKRHVKMAPCCHKRHLRAAVIESAFWAKVSFLPFFSSNEGKSFVSVNSRLGAISCMSPSTNGNFLAIGTNGGGMVVFDLRSDPRNPWFEVVGNGAEKNLVPAKAKSSVFGGESKAKPTGKTQTTAPVSVVEVRERADGGGSDFSPITALAWSADSFQIASLSDQGTMRVWLMKPSDGEVIRDNDTSSRQPVTPFLVAAVSSDMMSSSGKEAIQEEEDLLGLGEDDSDAVAMKKLQEENEVIQRGRNAKKGVATSRADDPGGLGAAGPSASALSNRQTCISFHRSFTILASQPSVLLPCPTGDILSISLTALGTLTLPMPLPLGSRVNYTPRAAPLTHQAIEWIMPPKRKSNSIKSQSSYRGHEGRVVFISFLSDSQTLISVDDNGMVLLWPALEIEKSGFGWFQPKTIWSLPQFLISHRSHGPPSTIWPRRGGGGGGGGGGGPAVGVTLFGWMPAPASKGPANPSTFTPPGPSAPPPAPTGTFESYRQDESLHDDDKELKRLDEDSQGSFLLDPSARCLWLVRYSKQGGKMVREEIHAPLPLPPPGSISKKTGKERKSKSRSGSIPLPLVISTYDLTSGTLLQRIKQHSSQQKCDYKVTSASMTPSQRDLLLWCRVNGAPRDSNSFPFYSCHIVNIESRSPKTPRIDVIDHSNGSSPPAFAVSHTISALGSEYLFVGLGWGMVGIYSIATGRLVREICLVASSPPPFFSSLHLFSVTNQLGEFKNAGKTLLAAVPCNGSSVVLVELNDDLTLSSNRS